MEGGNVLAVYCNPQEIGDWSKNTLGEANDARNPQQVEGVPQMHAVGVSKFPTEEPSSDSLSDFETLGETMIAKNDDFDLDRISLTDDDSIEDSVYGCLVCFDGGNLLVCDRRNCNMAYHLECIGLNEASFNSRVYWSCDRHTCNNCKKDADYMCYTCTYSLCMTCMEEADFFCVRGSSGFCVPCMEHVKQIEEDEQRNKREAPVGIDYDDSLGFSFKDYWIKLKEKLLIAEDELKQAGNPRKRSNPGAN